ncbi:DUF3549 family protein [Pseudoalteromonas tunicata]|uniref:DUF3549 family protein n=1 Tax=Pseudoalteromonas tunicata TaxID=314281 RepID=UPI00273E73B9|nr:DUF3549 family protein [Pseudoalteromonas tunicata]MDP4982339.1 DUF3549 family protein [Pseudoalteromonas tunicata]
MEKNIATLAQLLDAAGTQWRVYDIGRRIAKIDKATFAKIESTQIPYPTPLQQHAMIAIQFWDARASKEPYIWFLKFPLDEQNKLNQASRNHFADMVLEALGTQLTGQDEQAQQLNNNPYVFTPNVNKRAAFNALMKVELNQGASIYYEHAQLYFSGKIAIDSWQTLALQGIADFAMRLHQDNNSEKLLSVLNHLPEEVFNPLSSILEHVCITTTVAESLLKLGQQSLTLESPNTLIYSLRALSNAAATGLVDQLVDEALQSKHAHNTDLQLILAGRCWRSFSQPERLHLYMDHVAHSPVGPELFAGIFADLVAISELRPHVLNLLRIENRSETLARAIGSLFK